MNWEGAVWHPVAAAGDLNVIDGTLYHLGMAIVYGVLGIAMFAIALKIIVKVSPFAIRKELEEDQNTALGIVIGSIFIGLAIILAAAIQG